MNTLWPEVLVIQRDRIESQGKRWCISKLNRNVDIRDGGAEDDGSQDLREDSFFSLLKNR
jgi:hypothetical protein